MFTQLDVRRENGTLAISLPMPNVLLPGSGPDYLITDISGLDPVDASIQTSGYSNMDGATYQSSKVAVRNIIITMQYNRHLARSGKTVESLRKALYPIFAPKKMLDLRFIEPGSPNTRRINGWVESHSTNPFSQVPEVQISILCPNPYFRPTQSVNVNGVTGPSQTYEWQGDVDTPFFFRMVASSRTIMTSLRLNGVEGIRYSGELLAGDVLTINTVRGEKYIRRNRGGATVNVLDGVTSGGLAMSLQEGGTFGLQNVLDGTSNAYTLTYTPNYIGL